MDLRYTNVFDIEWRIPEATLQTAVPPMLLQPILENAIFHRIKGLERKLHITVAARLENDNRSLVIEVTDDGVGFPEGMLSLEGIGTDADSSHIGLRNVRDRIRLRFGEEYGLTVTRSGGLTSVILHMPYRSMETEGDGHVESDGG